MRHFPRLAVALTFAFVASPALADSTPFQLTSAWQKIASANTNVIVYSSGYAVLSTTTAGGLAPSVSAGFAISTPQCLAPTGDVWATGSGVVTVTPSVTCVGAAGGGGSGGSVTQGTTPWTENVSQFGGAAVVTGTGVSGAGVPRVTVASDSALTVSASALPTGAATSTLQNSTITTLGSPFQAGGSIGNTGFAVTNTPTVNIGTLNGAATAANQNVTAAGTSATNAQAIQGVTGGVPQNVSNGGTFAVQNTAATPTGANTIGSIANTGFNVNNSPTVNGPETNGAATTGGGTRLMGSDGTAARDVSITTSGALQPATAASGKITKTSTSLTASTSTTIAAANTNRIAMGIQCASGGVSIDETGGTLAGATVGNGTIIIPAGTSPYFTPPVASRTAITAYTATAQICVVTEYNQ